MMKGNESFQQQNYATPPYPAQPGMMVPNPNMIPPVAGIYPSAPPSYDEATGTARPAPYMPTQDTVFVSQTVQPGAPVYVPQIQPTVFAMHFGPNRCQVKCPSCNADVLTRTESGPSCIAHLCCLLLALMQCYLCSCLPYCMDSLQTVRHYCPNCNTYLGRYEP